LLSYDETVGRVRFVVTDRLGGSSEPPYDSLNLGAGVADDPTVVAANRRRVEARLDLTSRLAFMAQHHSAEVAVLTDLPSEPLPVDAIVTDRPGLGLAVLVADCAPVLLADEARGIVAAVHAGRRGLLTGVLHNAVAAMRDLGSTSITGRVGPAICGLCYELDEATVAEFEEHVAGASATTRWRTRGIDIGRAARLELARLGVPTARAGGCTYESPLHFSHRRDGATGRFAGVVVCR
jgi:YfiH family protein